MDGPSPATPTCPWPTFLVLALRYWVLPNVGNYRADIEQAARAANAHDFIVNAPEGYQTMVGERGMQLSGGERQRISIARAFIKNAPILILDEPTSSVDVQTEARIMEAMDRLMRDKTTLMITHRLSTLEHCQVIMTIENGRLVQVQRVGEKSDLPVEDSFIL